MKRSTIVKTVQTVAFKCCTISFKKESQRRHMKMALLLLLGILLEYGLHLVVTDDPVGNQRSNRLLLIAPAQPPCGRSNRA
jgi:hypothetical protein